MPGLDERIPGNGKTPGPRGWPFFISEFFVYHLQYFMIYYQKFELKSDEADEYSLKRWHRERDR